MKVKYGLL